MAIFEIPLTPEAQSFTISLAGVQYRISLAWNTVAGYWTIDVADLDGAVFATGLPLVTGADLLGQHKHLGVGGALVAQTSGDPDAVPTYENLGVDGHLYFVTPEAA